MAEDPFGHVKISRKAYATDPFWSERREFSRWEAWEYLIQEASWAEREWSVPSGPVVRLERGETRPLSVRHLMDEWQWGMKRVRVFLALLQKMGRIRAHQETPQGHTYILVNYATYQGEGHSEGTDKGTARAQRGHSEGTIQKQEKQEKQEKSTGAVAVAVGDFCERTGSQWRLTEPINDWAGRIQREPKYAGVDLVYEIERCAEWHEGKRKRPKAPDQSIRNWLENAGRDVRARQNGRKPPPTHKTQAELLNDA